MNLILIGGLPGAGKSTLAGQLAARYGLPLLAKDSIKEALLDSLRDPGLASRALSTAAFAIQFRLAAGCIGASRGVILEGNFRPVEHRAPLGALLESEPRLRLIQVLCQLPEPERRRRLQARRLAGSRHAGHQELSPAVLEDRTADAFLDLPGVRLTQTGDDPVQLFSTLDQHLTGA